MGRDVWLLPFLPALLSQKSLSKEELEELKQMINKMEYAYEPIANEPFGFLSDSGCHRFSEVFSSKMPRTVFLFLWMLAWCKLMIPIPTGFSVSVTNGWFEKMPDITTALSIPATAWRHLGQSLMKERVNHLIHMKEKFLRIFCPFYQSSL